MVLQYACAVIRGSVSLVQFHNAGDLLVGSSLLAGACPGRSLQRTYWECKGGIHAALSSRAAELTMRGLLLNHKINQ